MSEFHLSIYSADRIFYEGACTSLTVPTGAGLYGVLGKHRNTVCALVPGLLTYKLPDGGRVTAVVSRGMMKVEEGQVLVLVHSCERPEEIDEMRANKAKEEARNKLMQKLSLREYSLAQASLARAMIRLKSKKRR